MGIFSRRLCRHLCRRLSFGLMTLFGLARRGYFIPYRYAGDIPKTPETESYPWLESEFSKHEAEFAEILRLAEGHADALMRFDGASPPLPRWQQDWYPRLDGVAAYCLIRKLRPSRIVEVGSGHSTRFFHAALSDAALSDGGGNCDFHAIDPAPRADLTQLEGLTLHRNSLQKQGFSLFGGFRSGDVLAIDSSHIAVPGSDVDRLFGEIVPRLPRGAYLAIHDIFLPDPYPEGWRWRGYNEQGMVAALMAGGGFRPVWSSRYAATRMRATVDAGVVGRLPHETGAHETALWLAKV